MRRIGMAAAIVVSLVTPAVPAQAATRWTVGAGVSGTGESLILSAAQALEAPGGVAIWTPPAPAAPVPIRITCIRVLPWVEGGAIAEMHGAGPALDVTYFIRVETNTTFPDRIGVRVENFTEKPGPNPCIVYEVDMKDVLGGYIVSPPIG